MKPSEYWALADENRNELLELCDKYHPYYQSRHDGHDITAPAAEIARQLAVAGIQSQVINVGDPRVRLGLAIDGRNAGLLVNICNEIWFGMPESMESRAEPGFSALCDLCSEWEED